MTTAPARPGPTTPTGGGPAPAHHMRIHPRALTTVPRTYLTARERQALVLAANGKTNGAIARALGLSEETVKSRMQVIRRKLRAQDRTQAVAVALALGVLALEDIVVPPGANAGYRATT
ncbi:response regulator transcription factor (plasmid) [Streptomyces sp. GDS52]|uniref:response regulator transcription factor n=1 Tax=Streptomyces sp. GDS52 TaxID=3406419 RepID=UPI003FD3CFA3